MMVPLHGRLHSMLTVTVESARYNEEKREGKGSKRILSTCEAREDYKVLIA